MNQIIAQAEAYAGPESEWWVKKFYIEDFSKQRVVLENDDGQTVEIWTENFEANGENAVSIVTNNIKRIATLIDLFPKNSEPNQKETPEQKEQETEKTETLCSFIYQHCSNFEKLREEVKKFAKKHQTEIKQNSEFANWIEISEKNFMAPFEKNKNFYIYLGKKRKNLNLDAKNLGLQLGLKTYGATIVRRDLELIYSIEKENNENLKKELESYWNDLINGKQANLLIGSKPTQRQEQQEKKIITKRTIINY